MMTDTLPPKKEALLLAGKRLILAKGYTATTVDEMVAEVGITKGAFYYFFKSKEAFAQELLAYNWQPMRAMQAALADADRDPLEQLQQHIDFMVAFLPGDGGLMRIIGQELAQSNPAIGGQVGGYFREWVDYLQRILELAKERHAPEANFTPQSVMEFIIMSIEGVPIIAQQLGAEAVERAVGQLKKYLDHLYRGRSS